MSTRISIAFALCAAVAGVACSSLRTPSEIGGIDPSGSSTTAQGLERGLVFPDLVLPSRGADQGAWTTFAMNDLRDVSGERGVTGIYVIACSAWSNECKEQIERVVRWSSGYGLRGARFVGIIAEGAPNEAPTKETVDQFVSIHRVPFPTLLDSNRRSVQASVFPTTYLVDPRTMLIVHKAVGVVGDGPLCKSDRDCCDANRWNCSAQCSTTFGACLSSTATTGPFPALDALLEDNGAMANDPFGRP